MSSRTRRKAAINLIRKRKINKRLSKQEEEKRDTFEKRYERAMKGI